MNTDAMRMSGLLPVSGGQRIYWEEWGAEDGVPALHLHGGPGGGLGRSGYRQRFDLARTRVIGFEQRGCGRSLPHASDPAFPLEALTTQLLIEDIEALREARGVQRWILNGVSWGSTLALAYAQAHPERVLGVVLFAVTTTRRWEVDWITEGVGAIFPEAWDRFAAFAEDARIGYRRGEGRLVEAYARLVNSPDASLRDAASREWALWEDTHVAIGAGAPGGTGAGSPGNAGSRTSTDPAQSPPAVQRDPRWEDDAYRLAFVRLTTHIWSHDGFLDPPLLENMAALEGIPAVLIHGRRDVSGPAVTAWELHRRWPGSRLVIDEQDGHGGASMVEAWSAANA
jgi:proline iminopeptidase